MWHATVEKQLETSLFHHQGLPIAKWWVFPFGALGQVELARGAEQMPFDDGKPETGRPNSVREIRNFSLFSHIFHVGSRVRNQKRRTPQCVQSTEFPENQISRATALFFGAYAYWLRFSLCVPGRAGRTRVLWIQALWLAAQCASVLSAPCRAGSVVCKENKWGASWFGTHSWRWTIKLFWA